jgi:tetratricopeptide (TPR) repeat protein
MGESDLAPVEAIPRAMEEYDRAVAAGSRTMAFRPMANITLLWFGDLAKAKDILDRIPASVAQTDLMVWTVYSLYSWRREPDLLLHYLQGIPRDWIYGLDFNGPISLLIGNAQWMAGRKEAARLEWRAALKLVDQRLAERSTDALQSDWKGVILGRLGEFAEAEKAMKLAADLKGRDGFDWGDLFELKMEEGQLDAAMDIYDKQWPNLPASYMRVCPFFDLVRDNPRFKAALAVAEADPQRSPYSLPRRQHRPLRARTSPRAAAGGAP